MRRLMRFKIITIEEETLVNAGFFIFETRKGNSMKHKEARSYILNRLESELDPTLYYHSYEHTLDVMRAVEELADSEGIDDRDKNIVLTAAAFHDSGFLEQYNDNEEIACQYARQSLPGFDFPEDVIEMICHIIMATRHDIDPRNKLEEIMCDADHDYLGRKDYKRIASNLYKELTEHGQSINEREWITMQITFLSIKHTYFTDSAKKLRQSMKDRQVERLREKLL